VIKPVVLFVGETYHLRRGKDRIVYAGMPSEHVFSIVVWKNDAMNGQAYAWNLFFPDTTELIRVDQVNITVEAVTPEHISLQV
jgi:hypothetical protein